MALAVENSGSLEEMAKLFVFYPRRVPKLEGRALRLPYDYACTLGKVFFHSIFAASVEKEV